MRLKFLYTAVFILSMSALASSNEYARNPGDTAPHRNGIRLHNQSTRLKEEGSTQAAELSPEENNGIREFPVLALSLFV